MSRQYHYKKGYKVQHKAAASSKSPLANISKAVCRARATPAVLAVPVICMAILFAAFTWIPVSGASFEVAEAPTASVETYEGAARVMTPTTISKETVEIAEAAEASYESQLVKAAGLYVDGELVLVTDTEESLLRALRAYMERRITLPGSEASFVQDVQTVTDMYPAELIMGAEALEGLFSAGELVLTVQEVADVSYDEPIAYETEITYDNTEYEDYSHLARPGVEGVAKVTDHVVYINGIEMERTNLSWTQYTAPVTELLTVGTMERPDGSTPGEASGSFCWPCPTIFTITTNYEMRWGSFHGALDVSGPNCTGAPIVASDAGKVTWAGYKDNGYGYYVVIDHGNGYETLYAHCSELYVSTGDLVAKGDLIGAVGSTGRSTGAHLHFEVLYYGTKMNPLHYVTY